MSLNFNEKQKIEEAIARKLLIKILSRASSGRRYMYNSVVEYIKRVRNITEDVEGIAEAYEINMPIIEKDFETAIERMSDIAADILMGGFERRNEACDDEDIEEENSITEEDIYDSEDENIEDMKF